MEQQGIWAESFKILAFMVDSRREVGMPAIADLFQEVANNHAFNRSLDFYNMRERGLYWVLSRMRLRLYRRAQWQETLKFQTWVTTMSPFPHRHLEVVDAQNEVVAQAYTIWLSLDATTHQPRRLQGEQVPLSDKKTGLEPPGRIAPLETGVVRSERKVMHSDLDMLGHVNNVKYLQWMLDDIGQTPEAPHYNEIEINYLNQVFHNQTVMLRSHVDDTGTLFQLERATDGEPLCRAKFLL